MRRQQGSKMLKAINNISGIGLFCSARNGANLPLSRATLIYGENGRGKSTLASILTAAATGDAGALEERSTIDSDEPVLVSLKFENGAEAKFANGKWQKLANNILAFDSDFIEKNVHSGHNISSDHRKNLLEFAIGERAVNAQREERSASLRMSQIGEKLKLAETDLLTNSEGLSELEFTSLPEYSDIDNRIANAESELNSALSRKAIFNQPMPELHEVPELDIDKIFSTLDKTLKNIHADAESKVLAHFRSFAEDGVADWISDGQKYLHDETCPFCGQSTASITLIGAYQSHFNEEYSRLKTAVIELIDRVVKLQEPSPFQSFEDNSKKAVEAAQTWRDSGALANLPGGISGDLLQKNVDSAVTGLLQLLNLKKQNIAEFKADDESRLEICQNWNNYVEAVVSENKVIEACRHRIDEFKAQLSRNDTDALRQNLKHLKLSKVRHSPSVVQKIACIADLRAELAVATDQRVAARADLKKVMDSTLDQFANEINKNLENQFASFPIDSLAVNYQGGSPRSKYGIKLREQQINLTGGKQSFRTALSESDKRTMAFAFFLASTLAYEDLGQKVIIVDDPMSSLDDNRRSNTVRSLKQLSQQCKQLIVLAHDPRFLLELDYELEKTKVDDGTGKLVTVPKSYIKLVPRSIDHSLDPYTDFDTCDLVRECESRYAKHYRTIDSYVKNPSSDSSLAASAIRPLLEGYLHRRFPSILPANCMFGSSLNVIERATQPSPLVAAQSILNDLRRIGYFGNIPHHDTDPDYEWRSCSNHEILGYAKEALDIVHGFI